MGCGGGQPQPGGGSRESYSSDQEVPMLTSSREKALNCSCELPGGAWTSSSLPEIFFSLHPAALLQSAVRNERDV